MIKRILFPILTSLLLQACATDKGEEQSTASATTPGPSHAVFVGACEALYQHYIGQNDYPDTLVARFIPGEPCQNPDSNDAKACDNNDTAACERQAIYLISARNFDGASFAAARACTGNSGLGCYLLGTVESLPARKNADVARANHELACRRGIPDACTEAGFAYLSGKGGDKQPENGAMLLDLACTAGNAGGCVMAGRYYADQGDGAQAKKFYATACALKPNVSAELAADAETGCKLLASDTNLSDPNVAAWFFLNSARPHMR